MSFCKSIKKT